MKNSILLNFLIVVISSVIFSSATFGQGTIQAKSETTLPVVSNEVFEAIAQFYNYDKEIPLNANIISTHRFPYATREKIVFTGFNNSRVPAYLITPTTGEAPYPVVLIVDGIYGSKERWFDDNSWPKGGLVTKKLLSNGFAVLILDAVYHGERSAENDYQGPSFKYPIEAREMIIKTAIEYRRSIDYLEQRADIDTDRIGMLGLSMGGLITFQLTSIDARIKSAVAGLTPFFDDSAFQAVAAPTFASHVKTPSFLMFMANNDNWYSMEQAHQLYELIPISQKKFVEYDGGHIPPVEYVDELFDWFNTHLK